MNKSRKISNLYNVLTYDETGHLTAPAGLTLGTAPASSDNSTKAASTAWIRTYVAGQSYATSASVTSAIAALVDTAPTTLDTLNELAAALGDDPNFATTVTASIGTKVPQARTITINGTAYDLSADRTWTIAAGLTSFNTRTGAITLTSGDVTGALGYTPYNATNPSGYITSTSADSTYLKGTSSPSTPGNFALSIGSNGTYSYVQSHNSQPLELNPVGNAVRIAGSVVWHAGNLTNLNQLSNGPGYITSSGSISGNAGSATYSSSVYIGGSSSKAIKDDVWAGAGGYPGYSFTGGNSRFGFSSTAGYIDVYTDGNFYAGVDLNGSNNLVLHTGNYSSYTMPLSGGTFSGLVTFNFTNTNTAEWPRVRFGAADVAGGWDEGIIKASSSEGVFSRYGMGIHFNSARAFGFYSTGWDKVLGLKSDRVEAFKDFYAPSFNGRTIGNSTNNIPYISETRNLWITNPESYSGEVRLGAAWSRGGLYTSGILSLSTSSTQIDFVFGDVTKAYINSGGGMMLGSFTGGNYNENLRLVDSSGNYSVIAFGATGASGPGRFNFLKNPQDNFELRNGSSANIYLITQSGNMNYTYSIGVGVDPACKLHVQGASVSYGQFRIISTSNSGGEASMNIGRTDQSIDARWTIGQGTAGIGDTFGMYTNGSNKFTLTTGGTLTASGDIVAYSDKRVKTNVATIQDALEKVMHLRGVSYNRTDVEDQTDKIGVIAQETQVVVPEVVHVQENGFLGVAYGNFAGLFIEAFKEQQSQIASQGAQITELMEIIKTMKGL